MYPDYLNISRKLMTFSEEMERSLEDIPAMYVDDNAAYTALNNLIDSINSTIKTIEHYAKPAFAGTLYEMSNGKFELINDSGISIVYLSRNALIEVYSEKFNAWFCGKVKRKSGNYSFSCHDLGNLQLRTGMIARVRSNC